MWVPVAAGLTTLDSVFPLPSPLAILNWLLPLLTPAMHKYLPNLAGGPLMALFDSVIH